MRYSVLALLCLLAASPVDALPPPSRVEAESLIKRLGSDQFAEREAATKALEALGERRPV